MKKLRDPFMTIDVGIDLVDIRRIERLLHKYGQQFVQRFFSEKEYCPTLSATHYAKRFAAKEAFIKAIGSIHGITLKKIAIVKNQAGKPSVWVCPSLQEKLWGDRAPCISVSLTDEWPYAQAIILIYNIF